MGTASPEQFLHDIRHPPPQVHTPVAIRTVLDDLCNANIPIDTPDGNINQGEGILGEPVTTKARKPAVTNPTLRTVPEKYRYVTTVRDERKRICTAGDGNCFFASIAYLLSKHLPQLRRNLRHMEIRKRMYAETVQFRLDNPYTNPCEFVCEQFLDNLRNQNEMIISHVIGTAALLLEHYGTSAFQTNPAPQAPQ